MVQYQHLNDPNSTLAACTSGTKSGGKKSKSKMNNRKKCSYCKRTGHMDDECRNKKADHQMSGSTETNKGKSKDKNTKANIASTPTPTPQDSDSDDTDNESVNAALASIISDFPSSVFLTTNANFMTHSEQTVTFLAKSSKDKTYIDSGCSCHLSPCHD